MTLASITPFCTATLFCGAAVAGNAPAKNKLDSKVVVLTMSDCCAAEAWVEAERSTVAELRALGLNVVRVSSMAHGEKARRLELGIVARLRRAAGAVRIVKTGEQGIGAVEIWITDRVTRKTSFRTVSVGRTQPNAASLVALRVVELLRASLMETHLNPKSAKNSPPGIARILKSIEYPVRKRNRERHSPISGEKAGHFGIRIAMGGLGGPGGAGAHGCVHLAFNWAWRARLFVELEAELTVWGKEIAHDGARATYDVDAIRVWAQWAFLNRGRIRPSLGLGAGVLIPFAKGVGLRSDEASRDHVVTGTLAGTAQLAVVLVPRLWFRLSFIAGISVPKVSVKFGTETVAIYGMPYLTGTAGLEVRLP